MNDNFAEDLASRYAERRQLDAPTGSTWQEREADLRKDIAADPSQTVASFAWNFNDQYSRYLESLVASGDFTGAKAYYDSMRGSIEANRDALLSISQVQGAGRISDELAKRANSVLMGEFNQRQVRMSDGSTVTLGQVLGDNSPYLADKNQELRNLDFSSAATELYLNGDRTVKALMDPYLKNVNGKGGIEAVPNHLQHKELIESYVADRDRINEIFGDGATSFVNYVSESHKNSGCGAATMRTLVDFADAYAQATGIYGRQLAAEVTSGYNNLLSTVFRGDDKRDGQGHRYAAEISDNQRREFDAMLIPAIKETMRRTGKAFSFTDPRLRQGMLEVGDVLAYTSALGGDMFSDARTTGAALNEAFGRYIAESMLGQAHTGANIVTSVKDMREQFSARLVGGRTAARVATQLSGQSSDYLASVDKTNGTRSTCPAADNLAASAHKFLARQLLPKMSEGQYHQDALAYALDTDPGTIINGLAKEFGNSFRGAAGKEFASRLAQETVREYADNGFVCMEDVVKRLAYTKDDSLSDEARAAGERWFRGNVPGELLFTEEKRRIKDHYLAQGYTDAQARDAVAAISEQMIRAYDAGIDPRMVAESAINTGIYYDCRVGKDARGKSVTEVFLSRGRMDKAQVFTGFDDKGQPVHLPSNIYNTDRATWDTNQRSLADLYKRQQELKEYEERRKIAQMTKDSM